MDWKLVLICRSIKLLNIVSVFKEIQAVDAITGKAFMNRPISKETGFTSDPDQIAFRWNVAFNPWLKVYYLMHRFTAVISESICRFLINLFCLAIPTEPQTFFKPKRNGK